VHDRGGRDHFGVEQDVIREQAQKIAAVPIGTIHHRRDTKAPPELRMADGG
jgi:hypothetical protein